MYYIIYKTTNTINNKIYIGAHATENLEDNYLGSGRYIRRAIGKYGAAAFVRDILFILETEELMFAKEREIVTEEFCRRDDNYNWRPGGLGNSKGLQLTEEWKKKIVRVGKNNGMYGKSHSAEARKKMSESRKGKIPWNKGIPHSEEARKKMSESRKGILHSEETKQKMRNSRIGKKRGPYLKRHVSQIQG